MLQFTYTLQSVEPCDPLEDGEPAEDDDETDENGIDLNCSCPYPLDFWFEISCYIDPEDVERFARICKHCTCVVKSTSFWLSLYRSFILP